MIRKNLLLFTGMLMLIKVGSSQSIPDNALVKSMLIFPEQTQHVHSSCLVELPNGDQLVAWFQGSGERNADDVKIMGARLRSKAGSWSKPFLLADTYDIPDCNPVLFLNGKKKLFLVWIAVQANQWQSSILKYRTSDNYVQDGAPVWDWQGNILLKPGDEFEKELQLKFKELPQNTSGWATYAPRYDDMIIQAGKDVAKRSFGWMTRIAPLILSTGRIILPLYSDGFNLSLVALSDDDGATWKPGLPIVGRGNVQPSLVRRGDGTIVAYMRDNGDAPGRVQISESRDDGKSWTAAKKTNIPNTASVAVCKLKNDRWAFVGNDESDGRYRISLYLSDDEGQTWKWELPLENEKKGNGSFSYPSMIQGKDNLLHITYSYQKHHALESIKYVVIDPSKVY